MIGLTQRQSDLLAFIESYQREHGISPSFGEMVQGVGLKTRSAVHRSLACLEERGAIRRVHNRARAIEIIPPDPFAGVSTARLFAELERRGAWTATMVLAA